jgi:hypothetical protein
MKRRNEKQKYHLCLKCFGRIYVHRPNSHICVYGVKA